MTLLRPHIRMRMAYFHSNPVHTGSSLCSVAVDRFRAPTPVILAAAGIQSPLYHATCPGNAVTAKRQRRPVYANLAPYKHFLDPRRSKNKKEAAFESYTLVNLSLKVPLSVAEGEYAPSWTLDFAGDAEVMLLQ